MKGLIVGDENNCLPTHHCFSHSPLGWLVLRRGIASFLTNWGSEEGLTKHWFLGGGVNQTLGSWGGRTPTPPSLLSPRMNVDYISKHKKLCGEYIGICLLKIDGGGRGCQSIVFEAGGWVGCIKVLVVGDEETLSPPPLGFFGVYPGWMYVIFPNRRSCVAKK